MRLSENNYYTLKADMEYCSASQIRMAEDCEYKLMKYLKGEYVQPTTDAMLLGSLVDHVLTEGGSIDSFGFLHPEMYSTRGKTAGGLKSAYTPAYGMIEKCQNDKLFMQFLDGEHQRIFTGTLFGLKFKCKLDSYVEGKCIADLKTVQSIRQKVWSDKLGKYTTFIEAYGYIRQLALYQEIVMQNTGTRLPCYILAVSKEAVPDIEVIYIDDETLHSALYGDEFNEGIAGLCDTIRLLKAGEIEPTKCGKCDVCRTDKKITRPIHYTELLGELA